MKRENLLKRLAELEERLFIINMSDRWSAEDRKMMEEIDREIAEIKVALA